MIVGIAHTIPLYFATFLGGLRGFSGYCCTEAEEDARGGP